jgi:hypothetical protein
LTYDRATFLRDAGEALDDICHEEGIARRDAVRALSVVEVRDAIKRAADAFRLNPPEGVV